VSQVAIVARVTVKEGKAEQYVAAFAALEGKTGDLLGASCPAGQANDLMAEPAPAAGGPGSRTRRIAGFLADGCAMSGSASVVCCATRRMAMGSGR
jgi:hypothetical protein